MGTYRAEFCSDRYVDQDIKINLYYRVKLGNPHRGQTSPLLYTQPWSTLGWERTWECYCRSRGASACGWFLVQGPSSWVCGIEMDWIGLSKVIFFSLISWIVIFELSQWSVLVGRCGWSWLCLMWRKGCQYASGKVSRVYPLMIVLDLRTYRNMTPLSRWD